MKTAIYTLLLSLCGLACTPHFPDEVEQALQALPAHIDYNQHVRPLLSDRCFACHGPDPNKREAGLRLDLPEMALAELPETPGKYALIPGKPHRSEVVRRILHADEEERMPPRESKLSLSPQEKAILIKWIEQGATYQPHWAFISPRKSTPPKVKQASWCQNEIDHFVLARLEEKDWQPATAAGKATLLRRLSFDLTGLPPSPQEIDDFLADSSSRAYEKVVDRLLASPHYGEHMAVNWLDLARYADTHGYTVDRYRDMSPWRDWVIQALNQNMPFDQFVLWQLAGDMLPQASRQQLLATGFNRNHQQNMEGGIVPEEFRVEYVADRTNTLGTAFMGLTLGCARCHDHKFDPVSQKEYYQLFSFFNNVKEAGQISWDDAPPVPTLLLTREETEAQLAFLQTQIEQKTKNVQAQSQQLAQQFPAWFQQHQAALEQEKGLPAGAVAWFDLDALPLANRLAPGQKARMKQQHISQPLQPVFVPGRKGRGLLLDGDAWLDLGKTGVFDRSQPFTVSMWVNLPEGLEKGTIFHKGDGAVLYNFRGYHLALNDNRLELLMAHTAPYNAIVEYAGNPPRNQWIQLAMVYDGSGTAAGLRLYLNGQEQSTRVEQDHLYKSILFGRGNNEPGLQIGARWRGAGIKGAKVDDILVFERALTPAELRGLYEPKQWAGLVKRAGEQDEQALQEVEKWYLHHQPAYRQALQELQQARQAYHAAVDTVKEIMVMDEMPRPRQAYLLVRGQYDVHGEAVSPAVPDFLPPMPQHYSTNRLGLAKWLFLPEQPLTARVTVNRIWQQFFGRGLVKTAEDFGSQGELPSHPALLDWLAVTFMESGWDLKALHKLIVLSATYRQSSAFRPGISEQDTENRWLARGPSGRLSAEMIRDNALAASGLLHRRIGGPSVKPYQPAGLWQFNGGSYQPDSGANLYRRSLYTFWKRSVPHPTQASFDAPDRSSCSVRRQQTSTPLQALVLLNDPIFVEAARVMGANMYREQSPEQAIALAFKQLTGRMPSSTELKLLLELWQQQQQTFRLAPHKMKGWLQAGAAPQPTVENPPALAAYAVVASTIMNADATIVKR
ncbi:MAG: DUF1553 domain-containing protein [Bacteroidetes bacterium]|nr:MAG: DUF1553 domain-containing protein [Bacteroidota bacterium]